MREDLEKVELKIAYLERANNELSDVVYRQQQELALLTQRVTELATRLESMKTERGTFVVADERPPHY